MIGLQNKEYELAGRSLREKDKAKCGDFSMYKMFGNRYLALVVSDGVGSKPCDWLASRTTCEEFMENLAPKMDGDFMADDLIDIFKQVDKLVSNAPEQCRGMMATVSAVVWDTTGDFIHWVNVGDSRIYLVTCDNQVVQLSTDDTKAVNMRDRSGKLILNYGNTVTRTGLTNAFGLLSAKIKPEKSSFRPGDTLVLATDGCYNCCPTFETDILNMAQSIDLDEAVAQVMATYENLMDDDCSMLVVRNNALPENTAIQDVPINPESSGLATFQIKSIVLERLKLAIQGHNKELCQSYIDYIETTKLAFTRTRLLELVQTMKECNFNDGTIYSFLMNMVRKSQ